jgi:spore germination protein YaaH
VRSSDLYGFISATFRNDYALTLATRIVNGHTTPKSDIIPWNLVHVGKNTTVYRNNDNDFNTEYTVMFDNWQRGKIRKEYTIIKDMDFHMMDKDNFMELINYE